MDNRDFVGHQRATMISMSVMAVGCLVVAVISLHNGEYIVSSGLFAMAGGAITSAVLASATLKLTHAYRDYAKNLQQFYHDAVQNLYKSYGHDAADALKDLPKPPK